MTRSFRRSLLRVAVLLFAVVAIMVPALANATPDAEVPSFGAGDQSAAQPPDPVEEPAAPVEEPVAPVEQPADPAEATTSDVQTRALGIWNSGTVASVDATFRRAARDFESRAGLPATGNVDQYQATPLSVSASRGEHIDAMIGYAWNRRGSSYTWGDAGPYDLGFDCSGLVLQAMYAGGIDPQPITVVKHGLPSYRTSRELYNHSAPMYKPLSECRRGDFVFYTTDGVATHVALNVRQ